MASYGNSSNRITREELRVEGPDDAGWLKASDHLPAVGEQVRCSEGMAEVVRIAGKTGDGSRLLELVLPDRRQPFFAAASNVLVAVKTAGS